MQSLGVGKGFRLSEREFTVDSASKTNIQIAPTQSRLVDRNHVIEVEHLQVGALPKRRAYHLVKRLFDMVACSVGLLVLSPVMAAVAVAIKLDSPGPIIYKQERLGKAGMPFVMHKFRSMYQDAELDGAQWATENDKRATRVGSVLRKSRLDELPQLWDVLVGNMSLVGPRPERAVFYEEFEKYIHGFSQRLLVIPGITGLAQAMGGFSLSPAEKIVYDMEYIKKQGFAMDLKIILMTPRVLFLYRHEEER